MSGFTGLDGSVGKGIDSLAKSLKPYNKKQHIKNVYNKFKQQHGEAKAKIMLDKMMQRGYFDKDMSESLLGIDILTMNQKLTENMPNNNKLAILKRLLSQTFSCRRYGHAVPSIFGIAYTKHDDSI